MKPFNIHISKRIFATFLLLVVTPIAYAQFDINCVCALMDTTWNSKIKGDLKDIKNKFPSDSTLSEIKKLKKVKVTIPEAELSKDRLFNGHLFNYTSTYISRIEGVYDYENILQQNLTYTTKVMAFKNMPVNVSLFGRYTNSSYFRNYLDFNVDFSGKDLAAIAQSKYQLGSQNLFEAQEKMLQLYFNDKLNQLTSLSSLLQLPNSNECLNRYIRYKEIIANKDIYLARIASGADSVLQATSYIEKFDKARHSVDSMKTMVDSLTNEYRNAASDVQQAIKNGKDKLTDKEALLRKYAPYLKRLNVDTSFVDEYRKKVWDGFEKLSLGRSMSTGTQLSFQNISINGINTEYNFGKVFTVLQAGWTDFGLRDFVFNSSKRRINNFVYNAGLGIGDHHKDYLLLSFFGGKQNPMYTGTSTGETKQNTIGLSLSGQLSWKSLTLSGEIAQTNYSKPSTSGTQKSFSLSDNTNKAYSITAFSILPKLGLNMNGYYKYYGANYYGFNAYRINANNSQWGLQAGKQLFKNMLTINGGIKKNDYQNPYVEQVYSGKNTVTTVNAIFRKNRWIVSAGYIPSYQYVSINDTIYENRYQVINLMASYSYKIGEVPAMSGIIFNRFLNDNSSSAYFYGNSSNIALTQSFHFEKYTSAFNASIIKNNIYSYVVFDGSIQYQISRIVALKGGFKINSLSALEYESKVGGYGSTSLAIPKVGSLSLQVDCNYYPDINYKLYNNTMGVLSFTTYFK